MDKPKKKDPEHDLQNLGYNQACDDWEEWWVDAMYESGKKQEERLRLSEEEVEKVIKEEAAKRNGWSGHELRNLNPKIIAKAICELQRGKE